MDFSLSDDQKLLQESASRYIEKTYTFEARKATFAKFQERVYDNVLFLKFGDLTRKQASLSTVKGFVPYRIPRLWNVRVE